MKALPTFYTPKEVCKALKISRYTLEDWIRAGIFPKPHAWKDTGRNRAKRWTYDQIMTFIKKGKP